MSAPVFDPAAFEYGLPAAELDRLQATIVERLRGAGVRLPEADVTAIADEVLADVVQICLAWMEPARDCAQIPDHAPGRARVTSVR